MMYPQPITPDNKLPDEYIFDDLLEIMKSRDAYRLKCGNNTYAAYSLRNGEWVVNVVLYTTTVAILHPDGSVTLPKVAIKTKTTADRMDRAVRPLGYRVTYSPKLEGYVLDGLGVRRLITDRITLTTINNNL